MGEKVFMKGCEAVAEAGLRAGCRFFAGYPITPQSEVAEHVSRRMPQLKDGVVVQAESEVAAINMLFGASSVGTRCMTSSSSCGISLMSEGISALAMGELPAVICNFQRGGPAVGSIQPAQQDYYQAVYASGNGGFQMIVQAPATVQEAIDMTYEAFDLADKYRNPCYVLLDGFIGVMMEPVVLPDPKSDEELAAIRASKTWATRGMKGGERHLIICGTGVNLQGINQRKADMYEEWKKTEVRYEEFMTEDAELILTGYGLSARVAKSAVKMLREEGYKVGLIRPLRVNPFPELPFEKLPYEKLRGILVCEMSIPAQYGSDVAKLVHGRTRVDYALTSGGTILDRNDVIAKARQLYGNL